MLFKEIECIILIKLFINSLSDIPAHIILLEFCGKRNSMNFGCVYGDVLIINVCFVIWLDILEIYV